MLAGTSPAVAEFLCGCRDPQAGGYSANRRPRGEEDYEEDQEEQADEGQGGSQGLRVGKRAGGRQGLSLEPGPRGAIQDEDAVGKDLLKSLRPLPSRCRRLRLRAHAERIIRDRASRRIGARGGAVYRRSGWLLAASSSRH